MKSKVTLLLCVLMIWGCKKSSTDESAEDVQENAQQVGDVMASIDESGGSSATLGYNENKYIEKTFERFAPGTYQQSFASKYVLPKAEAASCASTGFATCNGSGQIIRTFNGCTVGAATFSGDVTLSWSNGATCAMGATGQHVTRVPNFTVTGRRNATLTVTKIGTNGQRLTWASGAGASKVFNFTNDGISRVFTLGSTTLFDQTTTTTSPITVTGTARTSRVMTGGSLRVTNNLNTLTCDYVPTNVTWASGACNCPTSGSWSGTCSNGRSTTLNITGCGTATYTEGTTTVDVTFDRCGS